MIYLYSPTRLPTLAAAVGAKELRRFDGLSFWERGSRIVFTPHDRLIVAGLPLKSVSGGPKIFDLGGSGEMLDKPTRFSKLCYYGVLTPYVSLPENRTNLLGRHLNMRLVDSLKKGPPYDYYTLNISASVKEELVISLSDMDPRVWTKVKAGPDSHPWIKTPACGWTLAPTDGTRLSVLKATTTAQQSLMALRMSSGIVTIGLCGDGYPRVFDVESVLTDADLLTEIYMKKIQAWLTDEPRKASTPKRRTLKPAIAVPVQGDELEPFEEGPF